MRKNICTYRPCAFHLLQRFVKINGLSTHQYSPLYLLVSPLAAYHIKNQYPQPLPTPFLYSPLKMGVLLFQSTDAFAFITALFQCRSALCADAYLSSVISLWRSFVISSVIFSGAITCSSSIHPQIKRNNS